MIGSRITDPGSILKGSASYRSRTRGVLGQPEDWRVGGERGRGERGGGGWERCDLEHQMCMRISSLSLSPLSYTHKYSPSLLYTHVHTQTLAFTHTHLYTRTFIHTHNLSLSLYLQNSHSHTHIHTFYLSKTHLYTHANLHTNSNTLSLC